MFTVTKTPDASTDPVMDVDAQRHRTEVNEFSKVLCPKPNANYSRHNRNDKNGDLLRRKFVGSLKEKGIPISRNPLLVLVAPP